VSAILQELFDSEINVAVQSFYDGGFTVKFGDPLNGFRAEAHFLDWASAEDWLRVTAVTLYPTSEFARRHSN
jgi:hypothetical protein